MRDHTSAIDLDDSRLDDNSLGAIAVDTAPPVRAYRAGTRPGSAHPRTSVGATGPITAVRATSDDAERLLAAAAVTRSKLKRRPDRVTAALVALDLLVIAAATLIASTAPLSSAIVAGLLLFSRTAAGLYRSRIGLSSLDDLPLSLTSATLVLGATSLLAILDGTGVYQGWVAFFSIFLVGSTAAHALLFGYVRHRRRRSPGARRRTLILGAGHVGGELVRAMHSHPEHGLEPVGFLDSDALLHSEGRPAPLVEVDESRLSEALDHHRVETLVIAFGSAPEATIVDGVIEAVRHGCDILVVPRLFELQHDGPDVEWMRGLPMVRLRTDVTSSPLWLVKLLLDRAAALLALVLLFPVMGAVALAVLVESGWPILFHQERVGLGSRAITVLKFRSLRPADEHESRTNWNIANDERMGKVGRFIRKTSIDELPQLINILRGDMSLVGPRPERPVFVEQFSRDHDRYWARHRVPVGLTGWSQVHGLRGDTSIADRARYDNYYIANWSLWLDIKIMLLTLREVWRGSGG